MSFVGRFAIAGVGALLLAHCAVLVGIDDLPRPPSDAGPDTDGSVSADSPSGLPPRRCTVGAPFLEMHVVELPRTEVTKESIPRLSVDERHIWFGRTPGVGAPTRLHHAERSTAGGAFGGLTSLLLNDDFDIALSTTHPWVPADGNRIYFTVKAGPFESVLWTARRNAPEGGDFTEATPVTFDDGGRWKQTPFGTADEAALYFAEDDDAGTLRIAVAERLDVASFGQPALLTTTLGGVMMGAAPALSFDERELFFSSETHVYLATRQDPKRSFGPPAIVAELEPDGGLLRSLPGWLSPDACRLYLSSETSTTSVIYVANREPL